VLHIQKLVSPMQREAWIKGERVPLGSVEAALARESGVEECAVIGLPDPEYG